MDDIHARHVTSQGLKRLKPEKKKVLQQPKEKERQQAAVNKTNTNYKHLQQIEVMLQRQTHIYERHTEKSIKDK